MYSHLLYLINILIPHIIRGLFHWFSLQNPASPWPLTKVIVFKSSPIKFISNKYCTFNWNIHSLDRHHSKELLFCVHKRFQATNVLMQYNKKIFFRIFDRFNLIYSFFISAWAVSSAVQPAPERRVILRQFPAVNVPDLERVPAS